MEWYRECERFDGCRSRCGCEGYCRIAGYSESFRSVFLRLHTGGGASNIERLLESTWTPVVSVYVNGVRQVTSRVGRLTQRTARRPRLSPHTHHAGLRRIDPAVGWR